MSGKNSFIIFYELEEQTADFSDAQLGQLLRAIFEFEKRGNMPVITDIAVRTAFKFVSAQLDRGKAKYDDVCSKRQEAGKKGGRPAKAKDLKEKQKNQLLFEKAKKADSDPERDSDSDSERDPESVPDPERDPESDSERESEKKGAIAPIYTGKESAVITEVITFLNLTIAANFKSTSEKTKKLIKARLNEGFTVDDFKTVILNKYADWGKDPEMSKYLRPETLFGNKFESYLNQRKGKSEANPFKEIFRSEIYE